VALAQPAQPAIAAALAAPSAALFEKTVTAGATPSGRGTTVTIKITVEAAE
jgi:hypothetical protein